MLETITLILNRLDALFRYFLPGVVVLSAAYLSSPSWFAKCTQMDTRTTLSLGGLSLVIGALAYVLHRFSIHQALDYICWRWLNAWGKKYRDALKDAVEKGVPKEMRNDHIAVRSSQLIFLFISVEAILLFFTIVGPETDSILATHSGLRWTLLAGAIIACAPALWQFTL